MQPKFQLTLWFLVHLLECQYSQRSPWAHQQASAHSTTSQWNQRRPSFMKPILPNLVGNPNKKPPASSKSSTDTTGISSTLEGTFICSINSCEIREIISLHNNLASPKKNTTASCSLHMWSGASPELN